MGYGLMTRKMVAAQRMRAGGVIMEQSVRVYNLDDLPRALDFLIDHFRGQNVLRAIVKALVERALDLNDDVLTNAAETLGVSDRVLCYQRQKLTKGEQNEEP
jgi:hypothetical protein